MTLSTSPIAAPGAAPERWMLVLHGILGSGANWRTFARELAARRPGWGFVLVDLRAHGASDVAAPPHTVVNAAADLRALGRERAIAGVIAHSFGGKVALAYAAQRASEGDPLARAFVLDASPSARSDDVGEGDPRKVVRFLRTVVQPLPSRERFYELATAAGFSRPLAEWLGTNVRRSADGFRMRLDLDVITALLDDYFALDAWAMVERVATTTHLDFVIAGRSTSVTPSDRERLVALAARLPLLRVHVLPNAGHWVHVDDPAGLLAYVDAALAEPG